MLGISGTGWFLSPRSMATVAHVAEAMHLSGTDWKQIEIWDGQSTQSVPARILRIVGSQPERIAVLELRNPFPRAQVLPIRTEPLVPDERVTSVAYPNNRLRFAGGRFVEYGAERPARRHGTLRAVRWKRPPRPGSRGFGSPRARLRGPRGRGRQQPHIDTEDTIHVACVPNPARVAATQCRFCPCSGAEGFSPKPTDMRVTHRIDRYVGESRMLRTCHGSGGRPIAGRPLSSHHVRLTRLVARGLALAFLTCSRIPLRL